MCGLRGGGGVVTGLSGPDVAVARVLRAAPWRYWTAGEVHREVGTERLRRRAVRRALDRLADAGLIEQADRMLGGWRWVDGADDSALVDAARETGTDLPPVAARPTVCPRCGGGLDADWRAPDGSYGCRTCRRLV